MNYYRNNQIAAVMIMSLLGMGQYTAALIGAVSMAFINLNKME